MAADMFLKIGDIKGESHDEKHAGEIEILNWSWGVSQRGTFGQGGGGGAGKAELQEIQFTHHVDKASLELAKRCATGKHIKDALLTVRKAGGKQEEYFHIKLSELMVTGVHTNGQQNAAMTESVTLAYSKIDFSYKPQKADGSLDAAVSFWHDMVKNTSG